MHVRDGMSQMVLSVGPGHTLRDAARLMTERGVGAAVVIDPDQPGPGIITERDLMESIGKGQDPDTELVADHLTARRVSAIHLTITATDRITPAITMKTDVVRPTTAAVIPIVSRNGWMLGPGRWRSSPAGGTSGSSGLMRCRSRRPRTSCRT